MDFNSEWRAFCSKVQGMDDPETMALAKWAFACGAGMAMREVARVSGDVDQFTRVALDEIRAVSRPADDQTARGGHTHDYDPLRMR